MSLGAFISLAICGALISGQDVERNLAAAQDGTSQQVAGGAGNAAANEVLANWGVHKVFRLWNQGEQDEAIAELLRMHRENWDEAFFRLYPFSEKAFISLSAQERDRLGEDMMLGLKTLRHILRDVLRRAREAYDSNEPASAAELKEAARKLGRANRAPNVPLLVDLVGKAIEEKSTQ